MIEKRVILLFSNEFISYLDKRVFSKSSIILMIYRLEMYIGVFLSKYKLILKAHNLNAILKIELHSFVVVVVVVGWLW